VAAEDVVSFTLLQDQLQSVLATLSEREAGIVRLRFGLTDGQPRTLDEIGHAYEVTRERIRQIESKTMAKLRHPSRAQALRDFLN
jgi:RNA polymerase primary sigma factor